MTHRPAKEINDNLIKASANHGCGQWAKAGWVLGEPESCLTAPWKLNVLCARPNQEIMDILVN